MTAGPRPARRRVAVELDAATAAQIIEALEGRRPQTERAKKQRAELAARLRDGLFTVALFNEVNHA